MWYIVKGFPKIKVDNVAKDIIISVIVYRGGSPVNLTSKNAYFLVSAGN